jgi:hypothetical protein
MVEGFEQFETSTGTVYFGDQMGYKYATVPNPGFYTKPGRFGTGISAQMGSFFSNIYTSQTTWYTGFGFLKQYTGNYGTPNQIAAFCDSGTNQVSLFLDSNKLYVYNGNGSTLLATGTTQLYGYTWYFIEFGATINSSTGSFTVKINGNTEMTATNVNTQNTGNASANQGFWTCQSQLTCQMDDIYLCDNQGSVNNTFLGDCRVEGLVPNAAGSNAAWTPLSGSNYTNVNEIPCDYDTTYNFSTTTNQIDSFNHPSLSYINNTVKGVQLNLYARNDNTGTHTVSSYVKSGSATATAGAANLTQTYLVYSSIYETDPNTSTAWTPSGVNSNQQGYKLIS